jgi:hypothetical protein
MPLSLLLDEAPKKIAAIIGADVASLYLLEPDGEELVLRGNVGFPQRARGTVRLPVGEGITGMAVECMRPISVVQASEWFRPINFDLLHRSNAHLRIEDGRNYLMMSRKKYDVITADLILPVHAGANHLYSLEYFELVRRSLNEDGILLQWLYGTNRSEYSLLVRTFLRAFPDATAWADGTLFVGSRRPFTISRDAFERKLQDPATRLVLESVGLGSFEALTSQFVAGPDTLRRYVGDGPILDDDRPLMEYFLSLPRDDRPVDLKEMRDDIGQVVR